MNWAIAGAIVQHFSFDAAFLFLAAIAAIAFSVLYLFMPETREKHFLNEHL
jgi:predicted MFS family arabinose efflux permease